MAKWGVCEGEGVGEMAKRGGCGREKGWGKITKRGGRWEGVGEMAKRGGCVKGKGWGRWRNGVDV